MRLGMVVLVLGLGSGCTHHLECVVHGGNVVRRIETEHFVVSSDLPLPTFVAETRKLEQLWDAWVVFFGSAPRATARLQVVLSEGGASSEFVPDTGGFVQYSVPARLFSTVSTSYEGRKEVTTSSNAHELVHLISGFWLPRQPRWISEGLARYLGDANFVREGVIRMGRWQWGPGEEADSLEQLWAWDEMHESGDRERELYQSAWAWMHYLSNRDEARLARLWRVLPTLGSPKEAFESVFPRSEWAELHGKVKAYLAEGRYRGWETQVSRVPTLSEPHTLEPWAVHLLRRSYLEDDALRRAETRKALALTPTPTPELTLARYEDEYEGPELSGVLDALPGDPQAMRLAAQSPDLPPRRRFELLERAVEALPNDVRTQASFAFVALARKDPRALAAAEKAIGLAPWWTPPRFQRASALAQVGRCAEADEELASIKGLALDGNAQLLAQIATERESLKTSCVVKP